MDLTQLLISLVTGAVGGNLAGMLAAPFSLGPLGNTIAGLLGGGLGLQILASLMSGEAPVGVGGDILASGIGGILVMLIVGVVKNAMTVKQ